MPKEKGNGEGSFRKKGNGWEYRVTLTDPNSFLKLQKSFTGKTKKICMEKRKEFESGNGTLTVLKETTLKAWSERWLTDTKSVTVDPSTYKTYQSALKRIQEDKISRLKIKSVLPMHIQDFFNRHANCSRSVIKKWRFMLSSIFDYAIENDLCGKNPTNRISLPEGTTQQREIFSDKEIEIVERYALINHRFGPCMLLLLFSGIRAGEAVPIRTRDIDDGDVLHISVSRTSDGRIVGNNSTKKHTGDIPLLGYVAAYIRSVRKPDEYVLHKPDGSMISMRTFHTWYKHFFDEMNAWCRENNEDEIPFLTVHSTRHTYSTQLYRHDVDPKTTQSLLRHSSIVMTGKYIHEDAQKKKEAVLLAFDKKTS